MGTVANNHKPLTRLSGHQQVICAFPTQQFTQCASSVCVCECHTSPRPLFCCVHDNMQKRKKKKKKQAKTKNENKINRLLSTADIAFTWLFLAEMVLKLIALSPFGYHQINKDPPPPFDPRLINMYSTDDNSNSLPTRKRLYIYIPRVKTSFSNSPSEFTNPQTSN